jgi:superfamily II DNA or RNA helicase
MENRFAEILSGMKIPFHLEYAFNTKRARLTKKFISQLHVNIQGGNYPLRDLKIELKTFTKLRNYQEAALKAVFFSKGKEELAKSGLIVLPCGAGKTLLGISACCKIKKDTLIVCSGDVLVEQWRR